MKSDDLHEATARVLDRDDIEGVLGGSFYTPQSSERAASSPRAAGERPTHY